MTFECLYGQDGHGLLHQNGGGDTAPHYLDMATIEVVILIVIIVSALRWTEAFSN